MKTLFAKVWQPRGTMLEVPAQPPYVAARIPHTIGGPSRYMPEDVSGAPATNGGSQSGGNVRPLRVCLVGPSLDILGGQSVQLDRLLRQLERCQDIAVGFVPMNPRLRGPLRALQRIKYVRTVVTSIAYWVSLRRLRSYDVIHVFSPSYWAFLLGPVPAMTAARLFGRATLLNYHSGEADDHLAHWRTARRLIPLAHRIAVPSQYLHDVFARYGLEAQPIPNFVEVERIPFRERTDPRPVFLSNRNLEPMYNVAGCVRSFARVQAALPEASLIIAGHGSERGRLETLVRELELKHVRFTGAVTPQGMLDLLHEADVLLNSPLIDNMPLSLIEAQAAGLPIVSSSTGGIPVIVTDGVTGLLVPPGDDEALAAAALRMVRERGLAGRLSRAAREHCLANYTWAAVGPAWLSAYRALAAR
jgi:glycosyltransferase involved in cell wall biosynthesis